MHKQNKEQVQQYITEMTEECDNSGQQILPATTKVGELGQDYGV